MRYAVGVLVNNKRWFQFRSHFNCHIYEEKHLETKILISDTYLQIVCLWMWTDGPVSSEKLDAPPAESAASRRHVANSDSPREKPQSTPADGHSPSKVTQISSPVGVNGRHQGVPDSPAPSSAAAAASGRRPVVNSAPTSTTTTTAAGSGRRSVTVSPGTPSGPVPKARRASAVVAIGLSWRRQRSVHAITDYEDLSDSCNQVGVFRPSMNWKREKNSQHCDFGWKQELLTLWASCLQTAFMRDIQLIQRRVFRENCHICSGLQHFGWCELIQNMSTNVCDCFEHSLWSFWSGKVVLAEAIHVLRIHTFIWGTVFLYSRPEERNTWGWAESVVLSSREAVAKVAKFRGGFSIGSPAHLLPSGTSINLYF